MPRTRTHHTIKPTHQLSLARLLRLATITPHPGADVGAAAALAKYAP